MTSIKIDQKLYINGSSETEELIVSKIGTKYIYFSNSQYRYIREYNAVEIKKRNKWCGYTRVFDSAEDAETWLKIKLSQ